METSKPSSNVCLLSGESASQARTKRIPNYGEGNGTQQKPHGRYLDGEAHGAGFCDSGAVENGKVKVEIGKGGKSISLPPDTKLGAVRCVLFVRGERGD